MIWFWNHYLRDVRDGKHPYAFPLLSDNLSGLPSVLVITVEFVHYGILISIILVITAVFVSRKDGAAQKGRASFAEIRKSFIQAIPALLMPMIVLGGIYTGGVTPTESAAVAVFYVLLIAFLFYRENFTWENIFKSLKNTMITTTSIFIILGGAQLFPTSLTYTQVTQQITEFVANLTLAPWIIMLAVLVLYYLLGTVLEPLPILFITIPILFPVVIDLGYDRIHFGVVTCALMMVAQITPPIGGSLFVLSSYFKENIFVISRGLIPYLYALLIAALILLYVPWFSMALIM
jgi:C4-dicarboxylate transporter, DctM subunit